MNLTRKTNSDALKNWTRFPILKLNPKERAQIQVSSAVYGLWTALTLGVPLAMLVQGKAVWISAMLLICHMAIIPLKLAWNRRIMAQSHWAKQVGLNAKDIRFTWLGRPLIPIRFKQ